MWRVEEGKKEREGRKEECRGCVTFWVWSVHGGCVGALVVVCCYASKGALQRIEWTEEEEEERKRGSANGSEGNNKMEEEGSVSESEKSTRVENEEEKEGEIKSE